MAAVAAEPGAAASTAGDGVENEPEPAEHAATLEAHSTQDFVPEIDLCRPVEDVYAVQECSQVQMEVRRPDLQAAGKAPVARAEDGHAETGGLWSRVDTAEEHARTDCRFKDIAVAEGRLKEPFSHSVEAPNEVSVREPGACLLSSSISDAQPSVVFLHSLPAHHPVESDKGLSLAESAAEYYSNPQSTHPVDTIGLIQPSREANLEPETANDAPGSEFKPPEDAFHEHPRPSDYHASLSLPALEETSLGQSCDYSSGSSEDSADLPLVAAVKQPLITSPEPEDVCAHPVLSLKIDLNEPETEPELKPQVPRAESIERQPETIMGLVPGSEVRVSLDHIIDDALVVSFRLGEKIFSGVLMDLSKR